MRTEKPLDILVVSNLWPPHVIGGYELGAHDVVTRLQRRGHRVTVLTSTFGLAAPETDGEVHRVLPEQVRWRWLRVRELAREAVRSAGAAARTRRFLRACCFEVVYLFNPLGLNATLVEALCDTGRPVVAYVSDNWVGIWPHGDRLWARWTTSRPHLPLPRKAALLLAHRLLERLHVLTRARDTMPVRHLQFVSRYVRDISRPRCQPATEEIIPWGIDVSRFPFRERADGELFNWVYVGQVAEHKGARTAIDAVELLRSQGQPVTLTLYGDDAEPYARALKGHVREKGLGEYVRFAGSLPRDRLPAEAYGPAGLLVFPTMWEEPFSITLLEAFASGVPVLTTLTGGTGEIVQHGRTATVFSVGSEQHLAAQWYSLMRHPERARGLARRAREIVAEHLEIESMVDRVERHLIEVSEGRGSAAAETVGPALHPWELSGGAGPAWNRAIHPDADGAWLGALWKELGRTPGEQVLEPEPDSAPEQVFPIAFPSSVVLNGRFAPYLRGRVLNAGAGTAPLAAGGFQVRLDLQLHNRPDVCADLHAVPFPDAAFDAIVSIAVLEHCRRPWIAMRELRRVLRPGGHLLLSLPFMQPAHANPSDYFRFTAEGMRELAVDAGLRVVDTGEDNSAHHTVAWFLWELLRHHPRHSYLVSDARVQRWFTDFSRRGGRVMLPTLGNGFYLVAER